MASDDSELSAGVTIEVGGRFNPAILQPDWLAANALIDESDKLALEEQDGARFIVSGDFTGLALDWARIEVTRDSFEISSTSKTDTEARIRELMIGVLELLPHSPVEWLVIEHTRQFGLSQGRLTDLVEALAPSAPFADALEGSSLTSLTRRVDRNGRTIVVALQPSTNGDDPTLDISVSEDMPFDSGAGNAAAAAARLREEWDGVATRAGMIADVVIKE